MVQNAAARPLTCTKRRDHITPIFPFLHLLPVHFRINFKILLIVFKSLNCLALEYLSELLRLYIPPRNLRSSDQRHKPKMKSREERAFTVVAPKLWNDLPSHITVRKSILLPSSKTSLKLIYFLLRLGLADWIRSALILLLLSLLISLLLLFLVL